MPSTRKYPDPAPGERFDRLTAIKAAGHDEKGRLWWYQCDCGHVVCWHVTTVARNIARKRNCMCGRCWAAKRWRESG